MIHTFILKLPLESILNTAALKSISGLHKYGFSSQDNPPFYLLRFLAPSACRAPSHLKELRPTEVSSCAYSLKLAAEVFRR